MISRRVFAGVGLVSPLASQTGTNLPHQALDRYFLPIFDGYLRNARRTSASLAVCDFEGGTILPGAVGRSGRTYDSVTRMMPAMAAWVAGGRDADGRVAGALEAAFRHAFDPEHPDYWEAPPQGKQQQRQVESSIVAWTAWLLRDSVLKKLNARERANLQNWLAACTQVPVRNNNWAWFTAVNIAARMRLGERYPEFRGDEAFMIEDLKVLDRLAAPGHGWYSDSFKEPMYDYYNFWVFASHYLYWRKLVGERYPEWNRKFETRLAEFLRFTPHFFGANGAHILYGRSLIYRFGVLSPLTLAYEQGLWPHSPGLLRAIVKRNLDYHFRIGGFDEARGKLRETYSAEGNRDICDSYIDNGHPYWGMQAFAAFLIPARDRFWTVREDPLPVESGDFTVRFDKLAMLLVGSKESGQVKWLQAENARGAPDYRDKYTKFSYSSHFPFSLLKKKDRVTHDSTLMLRNARTGACAARLGVKGGKLTADGLETEWWTELDGVRADVTTRITVRADYERREHRVKVKGQAEGVELVEGSWALGLREGETPRRMPAGNAAALESGAGIVVAWNLAGYSAAGVEEPSDGERKTLNAVWPRVAIHTFRAPASEGDTTLISVHYASPKAAPVDAIRARAERLGLI